MKIQGKTIYPTPGECFKFFMRESGFLNALSASEKKKLDRYATEEDLLSEEQLQQILKKAISKTFSCEKVIDLAVDEIFRFFANYHQIVFSKQTFSSREEALRFIIPGLLIGVTSRIGLFAVINQYSDSEGGGSNDLYDLDKLISKSDDGELQSPFSVVLDRISEKGDFEDRRALAENLGVSIQCIDNWESCEAVPDLKTASYLNGAKIDVHIKESFIFGIVAAKLIWQIHKQLSTAYSPEKSIDMLMSFKKLIKTFNSYELPKIFNTINQSDNSSSDVLISVFYQHLKDIEHRVCFEGKVEYGYPEAAASIFQIAFDEGRSTEFSEQVGMLNEAVNTSSPEEKQNLDLVFKEIDFCLAKINNSNVLASYRFIFEARKSLFNQNLDDAFSLYAKAFDLCRYNHSGELLETIGHETISLGCYLHRIKTDKKEKLGDIWVKTRYIRNWCLTYGFCRDLVDADDNRCREAGRRYFEERIAPHILGKKPYITKVSSNQGVYIIGEKPELNTSTRHKDRIVRDGMRDDSLLMALISERKTEEILNLLKKKPNLNYRNNNEDNVFTYVMSKIFWPEKLEIAGKILDGDISVETLQVPTKAKKSTAMRCVLEERRPELLKKLIAKGVDVNTRISQNNLCPLYFAIESINLPKFSDLFCGEAGVIGYNIQSLMLNDYGSAEDGLKCIKSLVEAGAEVDAINRNGFTALALATELNLVKVAAYLIRKGANVNHQVKYSYTPLFYAVTKNNFAMVDLLIRSGAFCDLQSPHGFSILNGQFSQEIRNLIVDGIRKGQVCNGTKVRGGV